MPTFNQLAGPPASQRYMPMISLTIKLRLSYKQVVQFIGLLLMLLH
jgi:hypothetical protein